MSENSTSRVFQPISRQVQTHSAQETTHHALNDQAPQQATPMSSVNLSQGHNIASISILPSVAASTPTGIQTKLSVGEINDQYEQEADHIADQVMNMKLSAAAGDTSENNESSGDGDAISSTGVEPASDNPAVTIQNKPLAITPWVQRQHDVEEGEDQLQEKPLLQRQRTAEDSSAQDREEDGKSLQNRTLIQGKSNKADKEEESLQNQSLIQRASNGVGQEKGIDEKEADQEAEASLQRKSSLRRAPTVSSELEAKLNRSQGGGQALSQSSRNFFEPRFGHDFSKVRIHADGEASQAAQSLNAQAFTRGHDIYFGAGRYQPQSKPGRHLLAHELTHTVQQTGKQSAMNRNVISRSADPASELPANLDTNPQVSSSESFTEQTQAVDTQNTAITISSNEETPGTTERQHNEAVRSAAPERTGLAGAAQPNSEIPELDTSQEESSPETSEVVRTEVEQEPASGAGVEPSEDVGELGPEYSALMQELDELRAQLTTQSQQHKESIGLSAEQTKQTLQQYAQTTATNIESAYDQSISRIQESAQAQRQAVYDALSTEQDKVNSTAETELSGLQDMITAKKEAITDTGNAKAEAAEQLGDEQDRRAREESEERALRVERIGNEKIIEYQNGENGEDIASTIRSEVPNLVSNFRRTGNEVAEAVLEKTAAMAGRFRQEAADIAVEFDGSQHGAREEIISHHDTTLETLQGMADDTANQLDQDADSYIQGLSTEKEANAAQIREYGESVGVTLDGYALDAQTKIDNQMASRLVEIEQYKAQVTEGGWYPPFVRQARDELLQSLTEANNEQQGFVDQVIDSFEQSGSTAQEEIDQQSQTITTALEQLENEFSSNAEQAANDIIGQMQEATSSGEQSMRLITPEAEQPLQQAIDDSDREWQQQFDEKRDEIIEQVDNALADEDQAIREFSREIDARAREAANPGILESIFDFVVGVFEGFVLGAWDMLKAVWEAVKTPLFWIVVAIAVVLIVLVAIVFSVTIGAVLLFVGKVLLVIGVIAGVIAAGYYLYLAITEPDLSPRERGRLVGRALFEGVMAFVGTGILKRLGAFAQVGRLRQFVARVGGLAKVLRLIKRVPDLEKLALLLDKVADADRLIQLLDKVSDANKLLQLLDKVSDANRLLQLLDKVADTNRLLQLLDKVSDANKLLQLLDKVADANKLIQLLDKVADADKLLQLLDKVSDAEKLLALINKIEDVGGTIEDLLQFLNRVRDADQLLTLLDKVGNVRELGPLLDEVADVRLLINLLDLLQDSNPSHLPALIQQIKGFGLGPNDLLNILQEAKRARDAGVPIGISQALFTRASQAAREIAAALPYGDNLVVQGSRVRGYSMDWLNGVLQPVLKRIPPVGGATDVDVAIRVSSQVFDEAIVRSFGRARPGSALEATKQAAIAQERIFAGHARPNLRAMRRAIASILEVPENQVQVTLVKIGGVFDSLPSIPFL